MNANVLQTMFKEMGVKILYIGKPLDYPPKSDCNFSMIRRCFYDIFMNRETKTIVEAPGNI